MPERSRPARITVVNDQPEFLELISEVLDGNGYEVTPLDGEATSIEHIADTRPDLLICDLRLAPEKGRLTGWEIVTLCRVHEDLRDVPLIVCSADARSLRQHADEMSALGDVHALEKPFQLAMLEDLVQRLLHRQPLD